MNVLVVGATGILGQAVFREAERRRFFPRGTSRKTRAARREIWPLDLTSPASVQKLFRRLRPDLVFNCAGETRKSSDSVWPVNAAGPWVLAACCNEVGARLVHVSSDCVFAGTAGPYGEEETPDATDDYGRSKAAGEVVVWPHLTVRTSFIGAEVGTERGLLAWFLKQRGQVPGFADHLWSGLTAPCLAHILVELGVHPEVTGLVHVAGEAITKADLLRLVGQELGRDVSVVDVRGEPVDRTLRADRLRELGLRVPPLAKQVRELCATLPCKT